MSFGLESRIRFFFVNEWTRPISYRQTVWRKCKTGSLRASFRPTLDSLFSASGFDQSPGHCYSGTRSRLEIYRESGEATRPRARAAHDARDDEQRDR